MQLFDHRHLEDCADLNVVTDIRVASIHCLLIHLDGPTFTISSRYVWFFVFGALTCHSDV